jgi:pimeloyl-ACP methyl ester carboxylesterase
MTNSRLLLLLLGTVAIILSVVLPVVLTKDNRRSESAAVARGDSLLDNVSPTTKKPPSVSLTTTLAPTTLTPTAPTSTPIENGTLTIQEVDGVDYYICRHASSSHSIVLLHGSALTKEDWRTSGIIGLTCPHTNVLALDLSTSADSIRLRSILDTLHNSKIITLPQVTLVTPSASGRTMVDWLLRGQADSMPDYMTTWVPVAVGRLSSTHIAIEQIEAMVGFIEVLAIYGDRDTSGGRLSAKLGTLIGATVVELPGGHPVYLESPNEFVANILEFVRIM